MSFYGKIYAQMDDVFHLFQFDNVENNANLYTTKLADNFVLGAESFNDKLIMKAGNSWIQFVKIPNPFKDELGDAVEIYHGAPMKGEEYAGKAEKIITNITPGALYNRLISDNSTLLTNTEKNTLKGYRSEGKLLFFGDTISISSPTYDKAGHITGYKSADYILSEIPRLEEFLDMSNDIIELQEVVGPDGYPDGSPEGTISYRLYALEQEIEETIEGAKTAIEAAAAAAESAKSAEESAASAEELAQRVYDSFNEFSDNAQTSLNAVDVKYASLIKAVGVSDFSQIAAQKPGVNDILNWLIDLEKRVSALEN